MPAEHATLAPENMQVTLVTGGVGAEHAVSLVSADYVRRCLLAAGFGVSTVAVGEDGAARDFGADDFADVGANITQARLRAGKAAVHLEAALAEAEVVFPMMHGAGGEDGGITALCAELGVNCVGASADAHRWAWHKPTALSLAKKAGVATLPWRVLRSAASPKTADWVGDFAFPLFIKPAREGSSVGAGRADDMAGLARAVAGALTHDTECIVQPCLQGFTELEIALLGAGEMAGPAQIFPGKSADAVYDFHQKYHAASTARTAVRAEISPQKAAEARQAAVQVAAAMGLSGMARIDFLLAADGTLLFNEVNTIPGFTPISLYPRMWENAANLPGPALCRRLVELAKKG